MHQFKERQTILFLNKDFSAWNTTKNLYSNLGNEKKVFKVGSLSKKKIKGMFMIYLDFNTIDYSTIFLYYRRIVKSLISSMIPNLLFRRFLPVSKLLAVIVISIIRFLNMSFIHTPFNNSKELVFTIQSPFPKQYVY